MIWCYTLLHACPEWWRWWREWTRTPRRRPAAAWSCRGRTPGTTSRSCRGKRLLVEYVDIEWHPLYHLYFISVKVMGIVTRHCHRSDTARFIIRRFLPNKEQNGKISFLKLYLAFLRFGRNMTAPITKRFPRVPPKHCNV